MRRILLIAVTSVLAISCAKNKTTRITGSFAGVDKGTVYLESVTTKDRKILDSAITTQNGDFKIKLKATSATPSFYNIVYKGSVIPLILSAGDKINVSSMGDLASNYIVEGSEDSKLLQEFNAIYSKGLNSLDSLANIYSKRGVYDADGRMEIIAKYTQIYTDTKREHIKFIVTHPASMASIYALYQRLPNDQSLLSSDNDIVYYRLVADSLGIKYPDSPHVKSLLKDIDNQQKALNFAADVINKAQNAPIFPEIALNDMFGKTQKLSSLKGKVIIVDFWTVADSKSNIQNAEMKELYNAYKDKGLEIYQVALGDEKTAWITTVQGQKLPWINVLDPRGGAGIAAMSYNVTAVPSNIIIDKDGNIAAKNLFGTALSTKIDQLTK